jgi:PQQ-dependent catabolism-associated CXXCW motif protein
VTNGRWTPLDCNKVISKTAFALLAASLLHAAPAAAAGGTVAEPAGYRMEDYKSPVPRTLEGARVVTTEEAAVLWEEKRTVFFDVMPHMPKPDKLPAGTIWRDKVRKDIPGSVWLPNTGYGAISKKTADYFRAGLANYTGGGKSRPVLFYCMTDCWMSWNAAKRAVEWGHGAVVWYPAGADGWEAANLPLVEATPYEAR